MAGLNPKKRSGVELKRANDQLLQRHREHLQSWVEHKTTSDQKEGGSTGRSDAVKKENN